MIQPYIASVNGLARAEPSRLINHADRKLSEQIKCVEDPLRIHEKNSKVLSALPP